MYQDPYVPSHSPMWSTPEKYIPQKLRILTEDFCIHPTEEEIAHLYTLKTQIAIDNAILGIINRRWDN